MLLQHPLWRQPFEPGPNHSWVNAYDQRPKTVGHCWREKTELHGNMVTKHSPMSPWSDGQNQRPPNGPSKMEHINTFEPNLYNPP